MKTKFTNWIKIIPWFIGFLLSTAGMFLGYNLGSDIASLIGGEPGIWARLGKGFVWGGIIAALHWPIVKSVGVPPFQLIFACAFCFAAGYPIAQTIQGIFVFNCNLHLTGYWFCVATFGLFLGLPQWIVFRRYLKNSMLLVFFNVAGWIIKGFLLLNGIPSDFGYGIVVGPGLVWMVHSKKINQSLNGSDDSIFVKTE